MTRGTGRIVTALAASVVCVSGCAAEAESVPAALPTEAAYELAPEPGRTIDVTPPASDLGLDGYRITAVLPDDSAASATLLSAITGIATERGAEFDVISADPVDEDPVREALADALGADPDLIVGLGEGAVDAFGFESAQWLDQQFLLVGAQLAEPTDNVTAVVWDGATSRGSSASADGELDDASITEDRGQDAFDAGLESIRDDVTGIVLHLG